jgi:FAD:protein FMN transferase
VDEEYLLGTVIRATVYADNAADLLDSVFDRVAEIEAKMSTSEDDYDRTELLDVNRAPAGTDVTVSQDTFEVLREALRYSRLSDGAFDVTVWPLVKLWGIGSGNETVPAEDLIAEALALVDHRRLSLNDDGTVTLPDEGMGLDVGAIAKGYAADEAAAILRDGGVDHALLDFGGNILVIGDKPDGTAWRIGVQRPDARRSEYIGIVSAVDRTVVTSGPYERFFVEDGVRYHHILDPKTGYPSRNGLEQVTIVSERSIDADALSTAGYILGLEEAWKLVESLDGVEAIFATEDRRVYVTPGLTDPDGAARFRKTDEEYRLIEGAPGEE